MSSRPNRGSALNVGNLEQIEDEDAPSRPQTWKELREWDRMEEDEIRRFETLRERRSTFQVAYGKFKQNPIPYILAPCIGYCIFAGLNALQTGHAYMAIKYLGTGYGLRGQPLPLSFSVQCTGSVRRERIYSK